MRVPQVNAAVNAAVRRMMKCWPPANERGHRAAGWAE